MRLSVLVRAARALAEVAGAFRPSGPPVTLFRVPRDGPHPLDPPAKFVERAQWYRTETRVELTRRQAMRLFEIAANKYNRIVERPHGRPSGARRRGAPVPAVKRAGDVYITQCLRYATGLAPEAELFRGMARAFDESERVIERAWRDRPERHRRRRRT